MLEKKKKKIIRTHTRVQRVLLFNFVVPWTVMRVFMRVRVHTRVRAYSYRVKRYSVLCEAENRATDCTRIFIRRILRLAERLFALPTLPPPVAFYGLYIRNPGIMQVYYSLRRRNPVASVEAFLGFGSLLAHMVLARNTQYVRAVFLTPANVLRHSVVNVPAFYLRTKLITKRCK